MSQNFHHIIEKIRDQDPRYETGAYEFIMEALSFAQKKYRRKKHVSGEELLSAVQEMLLKKFGPMTMTVLEHWGIKKTEDFGNLVFNLVENKVLSKTQDDRIENFKDGFDFQEVFQERYRKQLAKKISRLR